jgi:hypothetical protein
MKKTTGYAALCAALLLSGCISTYLNDETSGADGKVTKEVTFYRGGFVTATAFDNAEVNYQGVTAKIGNYSNKGDTDMAMAVAKGIAYVGSVYFSGGSAPAIGSILQAMYAPATTNVVEAVK